MLAVPMCDVTSHSCGALHCHSEIGHGQVQSHIELLGQGSFTAMRWDVLHQL